MYFSKVDVSACACACVVCVLQIVKMDEGSDIVMARPPCVGLQDTTNYHPFETRFFKMLETTTLLLGRYISTLPTNANGVLNYPFISREHAKITFENGRFYLTELGSRYGTHLNNVSLRKDERVQLKSMDIVTFGIPDDGAPQNRLRVLVHLYYPRFDGDVVPSSQNTPQKVSNVSVFEGAKKRFLDLSPHKPTPPVITNPKMYDPSQCFESSDSDSNESVSLLA